MFGTEIHKRGALIVFGVTAVSTSAFAQTAAEITTGVRLVTPQNLFTTAIRVKTPSATKNKAKQSFQVLCELLTFPPSPLGEAEDMVSI
jgi:hypothetical protein